MYFFLLLYEKEEKKARECFNFEVLYLRYSYIGIFAIKDEIKELHPDFETENNSSMMLVEEPVQFFHGSQ